MSETLYKPNTKVLAYHGPLIYEAKVLRTHEASKSFIVDEEGKHEPLERTNLPKHLIEFNAFFLHYKGWNSKWDEWVTEERTLEINEENLGFQKRLREELKQRNRKPTPNPNQGSQGNVKSNGSKSNNSKGLAPKRKVTLADEASSKKRKSDVHVDMSNELKHILVDDWEFVTKGQKAISLPVEKPVKTILEDFLEAQEDKKTIEQMHILKEFIMGLEAYFNQCLRLMLLYKFERLKYSQLLKKVGPEINFSEYYGLEHLLRLLVSLPGLIAETSMDVPSITNLGKNCKELIEYLSLNFDEYINEYDNVDPGYVALARS